MTLNIETLLAGEKALENAPKTELADGRLCVPQHYLSYNHTRQSIEALFLDIEYDVRYPVFVRQEHFRHEIVSQALRPEAKSGL